MDLRLTGICRRLAQFSQFLQRNPKWDVVARAILALLGGYAFTALATASLALALPLPRASSVLTATLLSFSLYAAVALWAFTARTAGRAWSWVVFVSLVPATHLGFWGLWT